MSNYSFAGLCVEILPDDSNDVLSFEPFKSAIDEKPDFRLAYRGCNVLCRPEGRQILRDLIFEDIIMTITETSPDSMCFHLEPESSGTLLARLDTDKEWRYVTITYSRNEPYCSYYALTQLSNLMIKNKIVSYDGLVIHASAVMHDNKGVIFTAPSGTGKSTHARLWEDYLGARVLNDDTPALRIINDKPYVYGTPWSGSTIKFENASAQLSAIIVLEQHKENKIERLNNFEALMRLLPQSYIPYYDRKASDMALNTLGRIISSTPVYLLKCTPEKEAMELVRQCIK